MGKEDRQMPEDVRGSSPLKALRQRQVAAEIELVKNSSRLAAAQRDRDEHSRGGWHVRDGVETTRRLGY
jgi:hypothetical protein